MEEHDISCIFVVSRQRQLRGRVTLDDAVEAVRKGKRLEDILITDVPKVTPTTSLSDIISLVVKNPYPVAVVDDAGRLVGSVSRGAVLAALARKGEDTNATA
jgi:glycine betaine/proline transport system ATP-binding protein